MWGEGGAPGLFMAAEYIGQRGREKWAIDLALKVIDTVTDRNKRSKGVGLADPYYTIQQAMRRDLLGESIYTPNQSFLGRSFCIRQFVEFVVWRDWRRGLSKRWYQIAEIDSEEFVPKNRIDAYYWYCDEGLTSTRRWGHPQSWSVLENETRTRPSSCLLIEHEFAELLQYYSFDGYLLDSGNHDM